QLSARAARYRRRGDRMKRREFITLLGGTAAAWPLAARAQQPAMPVIGYLNAATPAGNAQGIELFRRSLAEAGYVEGRTVAIEYRFAEGRYDRLPELAAELVRRKVAVIVATGGTVPALAAKAATATVPIVFLVTDDPVALRLVASFARPDGNATGINFPLAELGSKQLGLLREIVPAAARVGLLVNPNGTTAEGMKKDVMAAASPMGVEIIVVEAYDSRAIETAFATLLRDELTRSWSAPTRTFLVVASSLRRSPRAMQYRPFSTCVSSRRPAA